MEKPTHYARMGTTAIAAVLALTSTTTLAQEIEPAAEVSSSVEPAPATTDPSVTTETVTATPVETATAVAAKPKRSAAKPAAAVTPHKATPASKAPAKVIGETTTPSLAPQPQVIAEPPALPVAKLQPMEPAVVQRDDSATIALGGGLAAVALGGLALFASRRRRQSTEEVEVAEIPDPAPAAHRDPTPVLAHDRSAFTWGNSAPSPVSTPTGRADPVALARMGPTPENPSLSLKKRLKRAAFFEQRERAAAAGAAVPVSRVAGLPERAVTRLRQTSEIRRPQLQPA